MLLTMVMMAYLGLQLTNHRIFICSFINLARNILLAVLLAILLKIVVLCCFVIPLENMWFALFYKNMWFAYSFGKCLNKTRSLWFFFQFTHMFLCNACRQISIYLNYFIEADWVASTFCWQIIYPFFFGHMQP